jgi:adenylate cyclase
VFDYTAIGDDVNLASRLESANKLYRSAIMISEATYRRLTPKHFLTRTLDVITVKGKSRAVKVFEVYGDGETSVDTDAMSYYTAYQSAFEAYLSHDFARALEGFAAAMNLRPNDPASKWLIARIEALNPDELPEDWDGSIALQGK